MVALYKHLEDENTRTTVDKNVKEKEESNIPNNLSHATRWKLFTEIEKIMEDTGKGRELKQIKFGQEKLERAVQIWAIY